MRQNIFTTERKDPKPWVARYIGAYVDYAFWSFKPGQKGMQGWTTGIGVSFGRCVPLYQYNTGAIDLELGLSAGIMCASYDKFIQSTVDRAYVKLEGQSRSFHVVPFPMVTEGRVAFVWRKISIKDKYIKIDPEYKIYVLKRKDINSLFANQITKAVFDEQNPSQIESLVDNPKLYLSSFKTFIDENVSSLNINMDSKKYEWKLSMLVSMNKMRAIRRFKTELRHGKRHTEDKNENVIKTNNEKD